MPRTCHARHLWLAQSATAAAWQGTIGQGRILKEIGQVWVNPGTATSFVLTIVDADDAEIYNSGTLTDEYLEHLSIYTSNMGHTVKLSAVDPADGTFTAVRVIYD